MTKTFDPAILAQHTAILGKTGSGKTSTAKLAIEQVTTEGARVCILDTVKSDWWGITSSANGKKAGLPFTILGGPRGHVPLRSSAGKTIGQLVATGKLPLSIVDMADFEPGGIQRFFSDFAQALMKNMRGILYLVIEEAHEVAPKERAGFGAENMAIHYAKKIATAGRSRGIRMIVATQRVQSLHNAVLGSCETLIAHRFTTPADQKPIVDWLKANTDKENTEAVAKSLSSLPTGTGWICSGELQLFKKVSFPRIATYDNSRTPDSNDPQNDVTTAAVDRDELANMLQISADEASANDPKALKAKIAELERQLRTKATPSADPAQTEAARNAARAEGYSAGTAAMAKLISSIQSAHAELSKALAIDITKARALPIPLPPPPLRPAVATSRMPVINLPTPSGNSIGKAERLILTALAQYPDGRTKNQVAILSGYAVNGGGFNNALSSARSSGRIRTAGDRLQITEQGMADLGPFDPLPHGDALLQHWMGQLGKAEKAALSALTEVYPEYLSKDKVAERAGYEPTGGGFNNALSRLRSLELIEGRGDLKASDALFS